MISHKILIIGNHDVKVGDYAAIAKGFNIVAIAEVSVSPYPATDRNDLKELFENKKIDFEDWNRIADAKIYQLNDEQKFTYNLQQGIREIHKEEIIKKIESLMKVFKGKMNMKEYTTMLRNNHNLILTGAPGTGKTYLAKQIAQQMIFSEVKERMNPEEEKQFNEQCGFVQFHPSYDYTDFVEGLRPKQDDNGNVGFERKDGVFKEFCRKAIASQRENSVDNFNEVWDKLVDSLNQNDFIDVPFISNKNKTFRVELNEYGTGLANRTYKNDDYQKGEWIKGQSKFFSKEQLYNIYRGMPGIPSGGHDNYRKAVVNHMKDKLGLKDYQAGTINKEKAPYIFIIDEINRGEISKVFGELFFSIDPGYRGITGKVKTQYQNLISEGDDFYDGFYIPENVYIIGTMNDIDRSVESMDFAFRRRFAFKEIKADKNVGMLDGLQEKEDAIKRMKRLNDEISKIEGLSSAYHIGASYFLKLKNYDGDFQKLWEYHFEGLLREYLRGMPDIEGNIKKLKDAYNGTTADNGQQPAQSEAE